MEALRDQFIVPVGVSDARRALGHYQSHAATRLCRALQTKEAQSSRYRSKLYACFLGVRSVCFLSLSHDAHGVNRR